MTRAERIALHKKQERLQVQKNKPSVAELSEGIPELRSTSEGLVEYVRYNNQLYKKVYVSENTAGIPENPAFSASKIIEGQLQEGAAEKVTFEELEFDNAGWYTASGTSTYTIQKGGAGIYYFCTQLEFDRIDNQAEMTASIVHAFADGSTIEKYASTGHNWHTSSTTVENTIYSHALLNMAANDSVYVEVYAGDINWYIDDGSASVQKSYFFGFKVN